MPTSTYDLIASSVLSSSASSVTFSSISGSYRDLVLVMDILNSSGNSPVYFRFNSDTGSNYSNVSMLGNGSTASSSSGSSLTYIPTGNHNVGTTTGRGLAIVQFMDYSATDKHKTVLSRSNQTVVAGAGASALAGRWASTSAITSIQALYFGDSFASGSTFYLYGIVS